MIDFIEIDSKWQREWESAKIFEPSPDSRESYMVTAPFPYVNGPPHIGHLRTYGTADVLARYKRMKGFNVLFPMGWHVTGTPILASSKRIKAKDPDIINDMKAFGIEDSDIEKMTDPIFLASYFIDEFRKSFKAIGLSVDWRRQLISINPQFSRFIEWQFSVLNSNGLLTQGRHQIGWCPNENNAVGMHDTKHDVEPEIEKVIGIKFKVDGEEYSAACATYRPETIYGVTNIFVKEGATYVICEIEGNRYCMSKKAAEKLAYQFSVKVIKEISSSELLGKKYINPVTGEAVSAFPGFFVDDSFGTGMVISVPAHAPFDYAALAELVKRGNSVAATIKPVKVLDIDSKGAGPDIPVMSYLDTESLSGAIDSAAIEEAGIKQYREELHKGIMVTGEYKGLRIKEAREKIWTDMTGKGNAFELYIIANNAVCRCGWAIVVKTVDGQWFLNYGNEKWKAKAREALKGAVVLPKKGRSAFERAIEWIDLRAVARSQGLGTKLPMDNTKIIESLSDSTIYMSLYTIWNIISGVESEKLNKEFFDFVFLGKGDAESAAKSTGISYEIVKRCREAFDYWYGFTSRHSGMDLVFNHLTMYLFNHAIIFDKKYWPKQIAVNGSVLCEGEKMSKSLGNTVPIKSAIGRHGADVIRFVVVCSADLYADSEYSDSAANGVRERLEYINTLADNLKLYSPAELTHIDYWLYSKLNRKIISITNAIEELELRTASTAALYDSTIELKRYLLRGGSNQLVLTDYLSSLALLLSPITPHFSEDLWHMLGNSTFAAAEKWPSGNEAMLAGKIEMEEKLIDDVIEDSKHVLELVAKKGKQPKEIKYIVASEWKYILNNELAKDKNVSRVMDMIKSGELENTYDFKFDIQRCMGFVSSMAKKVNAIRNVETNPADELDIINDAKSYISKETGCKVVAEGEDSSASPKAAGSMPLKPGIEVS